jgi:16S rRNA (guanine527-N7)-methyltransferase
MKTLEDYLRQGADEIGISLSSEQLEKFAIYASELCKWNCKINLTSINSPQGIAVKHFLDSLTISKYVALTGNLLDTGSGGGFPGIPLKILFPEIEVVSVDAVEKKINFQRHIVRTLGLQGFTPLHARVENLLPGYNGYFNIIVSRAFANIPEFVKHSLPLLAVNGVIVAMKGSDGEKEGEAAAEELDKMGAEVSSIYEFELPIIKDQRTLVIIRRS